MVLLNILNRRATLYLQVWDNQGPRETQFGKVPRVVDPDDVVEATAQSNVASMWTRHNIICDFLYTP